METKNIIRIIIPVFFLHLFACQMEEEMIKEESLMDKEELEMEVDSYLFDAEEVNIDPKMRISDIASCVSDPLVIPLMIWPGTPTGTFTVYNGEDYLVAEFELDPSEEWDLFHTQLLITTTETKTTPGNTIYKTKKYVFPVHHKKGTRQYIYVIPFSDIRITDENIDRCFKVAGISKLKKDNNPAARFAIAEKEGFKRRSWKSWLHEYCIVDCKNKLEIQSGMAWMDGLAYTYNTVEKGYYEIFTPEMENKYIPLVMLHPDTGEKVEIGKVEIFFWGASSKYDLFVELQPDAGFDIPDAQIYVGILDPIRGPETFKNTVTFTDQSSLVFKKTIDYSPVYVSIAATACTEKNSL